MAVGARVVEPLEGEIEPRQRAADLLNEGPRPLAVVDEG